jgi:transglutaminase-like putative cysteine protease
MLGSMDKYLSSSEFIDWHNPLVAAKASQLGELDSHDDVVKSCFEYVRDEIKHSWDYQINPVTCKASEVLEHKTGYCYAKSHLLAALLRANGIPSGLCFQRLTIENDLPPFCLHGLNAVYLLNIGWYRIDARGNKAGVTAQFTPPVENLAFPVHVEGETDFQEIWAEPLPEVVSVLTSSANFQEVAYNLPDIEIIMRDDRASVPERIKF